jgi:hypothetical protein
MIAAAEYDKAVLVELAPGAGRQVASRRECMKPIVHGEALFPIANHSLPSGS